MIISVRCPFCGTESKVEVSSAGYRRWGAGAYVQDAFPELSASDRELLISGVCKSCQAKVFGDNDECDNNVYILATYVLTDENGQELEINLDEVVDYIDEKSFNELSDLDRLEAEELVESYLWNHPEITEEDYYYLLESGQAEKLFNKVSDYLY